MNKIQTYQTAKKIISGENALDNLEFELDSFPNLNKVLVITKNFLTEFPCMETIKNILTKKNIRFDIEVGINPEPSIDNIESLYSERKEQTYDLFIGIGGGSVLDACKMLSVLFHNDISLHDVLGTEL